MKQTAKVTRSKRGSLGIMESILLSLKEGPMLKTHITYESKLDSRTIGRYHPLLVNMNLIIQKSSGEYEITKQGLEFLRNYAKMKKFDVG